jgi:nitrite reductase/ring-hydroxylating ferredoxin subunit
MDWITVLSDSELPEGARRVVETGKRSILLMRHAGQVHAIEARCPHLGASLQNGEITSVGTIICALHHSEFDLKTGAVKSWASWPPVVGPFLGAIRRRRPLAVYPVRVEQGSILVDRDRL